MTNDMTRDINLRQAVKHEVSMGSQQANFFNSLGNHKSGQKEKRVQSLADRRAELKSMKNLKKKITSRGAQEVDEDLPRVIAVDDDSSDEEHKSFNDMSQESLH